MPSNDQAEYAALRDIATGHGQQHLLRFWGELSSEQRAELLADLRQIPWSVCAPLIDAYVRNRPALALPQRIEPARPFASRPDSSQTALYSRSRLAGEKAIREGRVAAFTVAGGQGTRLGYPGPKGGYAISPIRSASLFALFAENLLGVRRRYGALPPWYVMTSPLNHAATLEIFQANNWFGMPSTDIKFFPQGQMPAFLPDGRIALEQKHRVALSPDGHGGSLSALADSGALSDMRARGVELISYFQVDNPLVRAIDPLFLGLHLETGSEMSSKAVVKAHDLERVGNFCLADGRLEVIEYSDLPESLALEKNADGSRRFDAGSIAIHVLSRAFVERLTRPGASATLPWHRADKKVDVIDPDSGKRIAPTQPNVVKLEKFVFDAIPLAQQPMVLMTERNEEFSPVKNADGADSPATTRRDLIERAARWLEACGCRIPRTTSGAPDCLIEISPAIALDAADLLASGRVPAEVEPGAALLIA